jgi:hypothetical protein
MLLGAIAVGALIIAVAGLLRRSSDPEHSDWRMRYGVTWFTVATGANLVVGVWFLMALPADTLSRFMGGSTAAVALLLLGIVLAVAAFAVALLGIQAADPAPWVGGAAGLTVLTVVFMALIRDQVRAGSLDAIGWAERSWVQPQWGVIGLFLVLLVIALASVAWMVAAIARAPKEA